jgi:hypothetical protein
VVVTLGAGVYAAKTHVPPLSPKTEQILKSSEVTRAGIRGLGYADIFLERRQRPRLD